MNDIKCTKFALDKEWFT